MTISTHTNPQSVNTQQNVSLSITIINDGNSPVQIRSVDLIAPDWPSTNYTDDNFKTNLEPNNTNVVRLEVKPPLETQSGKYFLQTLTSTDGKEYLSGSDVEITGFDTIPLSGNVPLFLFVILVSGLITYGLASILLRHKVDFSYLQVSILSIALGLVNWLFIGAMASWFLHRPLYSFFPIQSIHNNPTGVLFLFIAGASIGAIVFGIGFGFTRLKRSYDRRRKEREKGRIRALNQTELLEKGYVPSEKVWVDFLRDNLNLAKQTVGKGYTLLVKVYLREPVNNLTEVIGLLSYFEPGRPYDAVLYPKHIIRLNKTEEELLEELTIDKLNPTSSITEPSPLKFSLRNDPDYRSTMARQYLDRDERQYVETEERKIDRIVNKIKTKLQSSIKDNTFRRELQRIDFSKHLGYLVERIEESFFFIPQYNRPLFINGENILSLEILGFHPFYALMLRSSTKKYNIGANIQYGEEDYTPIFPEGYDFDRYPFTNKGLINLS